MLTSTRLVRHPAHRRTFILSVLGIGALKSVFAPFVESTALATQMERGELHYKNANTELNLAKSEEPWLKRPEPNYLGHVPLHSAEKLALFVGSAVGAFFHPERNEFIVALGESTAITSVLKKLRREMLANPTGRRILRERPRMTSTSLNLEHLRSLPASTLGNTYIQWLDSEGVSPDTREAVKYIDDEELAYVFQRYRECHDFYHAITGLPIILEGEITVKCFEFANLGLPFAGMGAVFAPLRLKQPQLKRLLGVYYPWAIKNGLNGQSLINVYWEECLEMDTGELRKLLGFEEPPPDLRQMRRLQKAKA
ncbi:hypothetical protein BABINDRAFT_35310 [Babjeviella inositovora NRRL Y-12698]|uniref:4-hydroxy-3-methoxy-5-polyprenylbenzoate decarboxylase n=1 Tax=Babjeviella inositovora NRRL Y-12698 TaxID=984486 RepID=A0A1E3QR38_9ASCO|nr:uncharacterized protein BABINDRAFT_35310 [Babjeviella inositovora NRRL Y-12698]ODQ80163.1 hypothetical protein BABINDRAFT_35310 [Babjeviella inositovora NRRL Y-12698]